MQRARFVTFALALASILAGGCAGSHGPAAGSPAASGTAATTGATPAQAWKPGSHAATIFERLLQFRQRRRERFRAFLTAYAATHGDVDRPVAGKLRELAAHWLAMTQSDIENLPAYMKAFTGTGPYRRLVTNPGYSFVGGTVFLPCNAAQLHPNFEVAFAYVGGWGTGPAGKAVDAGFQRSNLLRDYAAFIRAQGYPQISEEPRFVCGHPVDFHFYAASDTQLVLWARGYTTNRRIENVVARLQHPASYGWPANGGGSTDGIVLKRMTTIAQNDATTALPSGVEWDNDGSYFGHYANDVHPRVHWWNLVVGQVDAKGNPVNVVPWGVAQSNESPRAGMFNYPTNPKIILFTCTACTDESDAINLSKGK